MASLEANMNIAIVYDSIYGNTAQVANAIVTGLDHGHEVKLATVQEAMDLDLSGTDLLVIGSPTRGFQPTPNISEFIAALAPAPGGSDRRRVRHPPRPGNDQPAATALGCRGRRLCSNAHGQRAAKSRHRIAR
jgi:hypothetical protein